MLTNYDFIFYVSPGCCVLINRINSFAKPSSSIWFDYLMLLLSSPTVFIFGLGVGVELCSPHALGQRSVTTVISSSPCVWWKWTDWCPFGVKGLWVGIFIIEFGECLNIIKDFLHSDISVVCCRLQYDWEPKHYSLKVVCFVRHAKLQSQHYNFLG